MQLTSKNPSDRFVNAKWEKFVPLRCSAVEQIRSSDELCSDNVQDSQGKDFR